MENTLKSREILWTSGRNDECMTLEYAVEPILKYIPDGAVVWCPFDTKDSNFVKLISSKGHKVIHSHISEGKDFYTYEPSEHWDCIVSNPPFTNKRGIFERALSFGKPFALIMSNTWLNDAAPVQIFKKRNKQLQLLLFDKRMRFLNDGIIQDKITFSSSYYCWNFLPDNLILEHLIVNQENKNARR